jgi:hypothetical protein
VQVGSALLVKVDDTMVVRQLTAREMRHWQGESRPVQGSCLCPGETPTCPADTAPLTQRAQRIPPGGC